MSAIESFARPHSWWVAITGDVVPCRPVLAQDGRLAQVLTDAALAVGNLEVPLTDRGRPAEKAATHRSHPDNIAQVKALGFDVVTVANNHALDYGAEGLTDTLEALSAAGVAAVGGGSSLSEALRPVLLPTAEGDVAVIGICSALPPGFAATDSRAGVAPVRVLQQIAVDAAILSEQPGAAPFVHTSAHAADVEAVCSVIKSVRSRARLVVVVAHWGVPYGFAPLSYGVLAEYQRPLAHALIDAGADLIVGHHPHMVQPIESYNGGLIAYSVGNFVFHNWQQIGATKMDASGHSVGEVGDESTFDMPIPAAPYRNPFGHDETQESVVVTVEWPAGPADPLRVRFIPTVMSDGDPQIPGEARSAQVLARLSHPGLPLWEGGRTPPVHLVHDEVLGTIVGEVNLGRND
jgi:poly-gamma-glutamate capsule biosynthesis protein CapA/YwtB (metallophosphatase superfamily)